ncbi:hypothetical protein VP01_1293g1 [Puccinia sorghi]|uniref:Uncharacterized protein n=1 Tax=Puccinia sorghi TaxID=27349 RepID=A0A0L6VQ12_9BASI|nr:hypothetical protein VP01_1293g1 [Puccinia sorghi]
MEKCRCKVEICDRRRNTGTALLKLVLEYVGISSLSYSSLNLFLFLILSYYSFFFFHFLYFLINSRAFRLNHRQKSSFFFFFFFFFSFSSHTLYLYSVYIISTNTSNLIIARNPKFQHIVRTKKALLHCSYCYRIVGSENWPLKYTFWAKQFNSPLLGMDLFVFELINHISGRYDFISDMIYSENNTVKDYSILPPVISGLVNFSSRESKSDLMKKKKCFSALLDKLDFIFHRKPNNRVVNKKHVLKMVDFWKPNQKNLRKFLRNSPNDSQSERKLFSRFQADRFTINVWRANKNRNNSLLPLNNTKIKLNSPSCLITDGLR